MQEIKTYEDAEKALDDARADVEADFGEGAADECWQDVVVSVGWQIDDPELGREFCRRQLGYVPGELESKFGKKDFLES